jgi:hypothetical protein
MSVAWPLPAVRGSCLDNDPPSIRLSPGATRGECSGGRRELCLVQAGVSVLWSAKPGQPAEWRRPAAPRGGREGPPAHHIPALGSFIHGPNGVEPGHAAMRRGESGRLQRAALACEAGAPRLGGRASAIRECPEQALARRGSTGGAVPIGDRYAFSPQKRGRGRGPGFPPLRRARQQRRRK